MLDNILLIIGAIFTALIAVLIIAMNIANGIGPYFIAGLLLTFSVATIYLTIKYWKDL